MPDKIKFEYKSLAIITVSCYWLSLLVGCMGLFFPTPSPSQLMFFQINDALAVTASVIAARYVGLRGEHVAASAFILLGITHGISMASSGMHDFNIDRGVAIIMTMIPALVLVSWCSLFPRWLRWFGIIPGLLFVYMYISVMRGGKYYDSPLWAAYSALILNELLWSIYIYMDWKKMALAEK